MPVKGKSVVRSKPGVSKLVNLKSKNLLPKYTDEQLTMLAERVGLTLMQLKEVHELAYATYQYIGGDLAEVNEGRPIPREELVEVVLDANRIESANHQISPEVREWLDTKATKYNLKHVYEAVGATFAWPKYE